ncbi:Protein FAM98B [Varanus komodoensis]|nr:Protein FAM98B [Varanus komodoensis]
MKELAQDLKMECDILDALEALGYKGPLLDEDALNKAAETGLASQDFCELCVWLSSQIQPLCNLEESISATAGGEDIESLQLEMSGFLKELACPYPALVSGEIKERLKKKEDCLKVLLFLSTELQSLQILQFKQGKGCHLTNNNEVHQEIQMICEALGLPKSSSSSDIPLALSNIESKLKDILSKIPNTHVGKPLLKTALNPDQMKRLDKINNTLCSEYECRRRMLMKRLDVTVQSFGWSDRAKVKTDDIAKIYQPKRYGLSPKSTVSLAHLVAAREDLSKIVRTSSGSTREICAVNKYQIVAADQQKLTHHLLKCHHGRRGRMVVVEEEEGVGGEGEVGEEGEAEVVVVVVAGGVVVVVEEVAAVVGGVVEVSKGMAIIVGEVDMEMHMVEGEETSGGTNAINNSN